MKNIKFLFLALATLAAGAFTACQEDWNPGPVDSELSVYLPTDMDVIAFAVKDNAETEIDESRVATFPVYRQNPGDEMVVEIRSRMVDADLAFTLTDDNGKETGKVPMTEAFVFDESVTFAAGKTVAYLNVTLDERLIGKMSVGQLFGAEIMVKDAKHHGAYGLHRKIVNVGIPETWVTAHVDYDPTSDEQFTNEGILFDDFIGWLYSATPGASAAVVIEQSEARPGLYRLVNPFNAESIVSFIGGVPGDMSFAPGDTYVLIDARDPEEVYFPFQPVGVTIDGFGELWIGWVSDEFAVLEDGIITFPTNCMGLFLDGNSSSGYYANTSGKFKIVLPGVDIADYSLGVTYAGAESAPDNNGTNAIVNFSVGADVSKFRFVAVEGKQDVVVSELIGTTIRKHFNKAITDLVDVDFSTYEPTEDETMAEAKPNETRWFMSFDEPGVYTIFAVAYDKDNNPILYDMSGDPVADNIASTYFYYRPVNSVDELPEIVEMELKMGAADEIAGAFYDREGTIPMDLIYSPSFVLTCDLSYDDIDYVSTITRYFGKKEDIEKKLADGATIESLLASEDAIDTTDWIDDIKAGEGIMLLQGLAPDTEYTMLLSMTSIYGKTYYYRADAKTEPYTGTANIGIYEFTEGDNNMQIKVAPYFSSTYAKEYHSDGIVDGCDGQVYLLTFVGDTLAPEEDAEDQTPIEMQFYAMYMPAFDALVCQGQALGYENYGSLFSVGLDKYIDGTETDDSPVKYWGYYSSSEETYEYKTEAMVLYLDGSGLITNLGTYFQKFYYYDEVTTDDEGEEVVTTIYKTLKAFTPETTVSQVESHMPVIVPDVDEPTDDEQTENETNKTAKRASVGKYNGSVKCELKAEVNQSATATVRIK